MLMFEPEIKLDEERQAELLRIWNDNSGYRGYGWRIKIDKPKPTTISASEILEGYNGTRRQRKVLVPKASEPSVAVDEGLATKDNSD